MLFETLFEQSKESSLTELGFQQFVLIWDQVSFISCQDLVPMLDADLTLDWVLEPSILIRSGFWHRWVLPESGSDSPMQADLNLALAWFRHSAYLKLEPNLAVLSWLASRFGWVPALDDTHERKVTISVKSSHQFQGIPPVEFCWSWSIYSILNL